jgi:hypothetical protein
MARFLYRPVVFREPMRVVPPLSWLEHIPFAFWLVEAVRPEVFVELGTRSGTSYAAFAQAVQMLELPAACYAVDTWRGDPQSGFYDESVFEEWNAYHNLHFAAFSTLVRSTFDEAVNQFSDGRVDLLHIDGGGTYESLLANFDLWSRKVSRRGIVLIHNINVRERDVGAWRVWERLRSRYPSFEFLHGHGLGVLGVGPNVVAPLQWLFSIASVSPAGVTEVRKFFAYLGGNLASRFAAPETKRLHTESYEGDATNSQAKGVAVELQRQIRVEREWRAAVELENIALKSLAAAPRTSATRVAVLKAKIVAAAGRRLLDPMESLTRTLVGLGLHPRRANYRSVVSIARRPSVFRRAYEIMNSGLFDENYYRERYPDVAASGLTPLSHFVLSGCCEGRDPHPLFDTVYYVSHLGVFATGTEAFIHYLRSGAREGLSPHPLFDTTYYLEKNPDLRRSGVEPFQHFLMTGGREGRNPNEFFDCEYYLRRYPDVFRSRINPLVHFAHKGWREGRRPSAAFDTEYYLSEYEDIHTLGVNPLVHYLQVGRFQGRRAVKDGEDPNLCPVTIAHYVKLEARSIGAARHTRPTILCLSHVMPWPPRAGNAYRIYRMLLWLRDRGFRIILLVAPLPGDPVSIADLRANADRFSNVVLCERQGRIEYVLDDVPDVLASLNGEFAGPIAALLDEDAVCDARERHLLEIDRTFCHDALIATVLRLHPVLGSYVLLSEYIWMSRVLPLVKGNVLKVIDTHDVFSTKQDKVLSFGVEDLQVDHKEEAHRLRRADLVVAIQNEERKQLVTLVPDRKVLTAGVDFDTAQAAGNPLGQRIVYIASSNSINERGLSDFLRFAWPRIQRDVPACELILVGNVGRTMCNDVPGVVRCGTVEDLKPLYREARLAINPAIAGTGLKVKILEALCHFRPIVTWPNGIDGLAPELAALCTTVRDWYEFTDRIVELLVADPPRCFSSAECDAIIRLTSPAIAYEALTDAFRRHTGDPSTTNFEASLRTPGNSFPVSR